jgi:hypothetical protein
MAKGGARPGAGRPLGSKNKYSIHDFFTKKDVEEFIEFLKANYMEDPKLMVWLGEHLFGKAVQPLANDNGQPLMIAFDPHFKHEN